MTSDVPLGILLSGGLDSSLIAHYASKVNPDINTFTVTFPGHKAQDESEYARLISKHVGSNHNEIPLKEINADTLVKMGNTLDEPIIDSSLIPSYQLFEEVSKHCKVVLGGDGADETFGGYRHHNRSYLLHLLTLPFGYQFRQVLQEIVSKHDYYFYKGRNYLSNIGADFKSSLPIIPLYFSQSMRMKLTGRHLSAQYQAENNWKCNVPVITDYRLRQLQMDFQNFLVSDILVKVDRTSMMHSVEVRAPFLNRDLLDYAFGSIPTKFKYNTKSRKMVLQQLARDNLPSSFNTKRKQGFSLPLGDWIRNGPFRDLFNDVLRSESSPFCSRTVSLLFTEHQSGIDHSEQLFALVMINLWFDRYNINF
jgi:asparagine synthase (glutamine-hydrolysing)